MNATADVLPRRHRLSVDDYHRMGRAGILAEDERVELIDGAIIDMTPVGSRHAEIVSRLTRTFVSGTDAVVRVQDPVRLSDYSEPQPDLAVVKPRSYTVAHPETEDVLLLVEVADTSLAYDREVKIPLYARHGIAEVWLVNLADETVEVFRKPTPQGYGERIELRKGDRLETERPPGIGIDVAELFQP